MPVNRAAASRAYCPFGGNWPGSNRENPVLTPSIAGPDGLRARARHAVSDRTSASVRFAPLQKHPGDGRTRPRNSYSLRLRSERGRIDMDTRAHRRADGDALVVGALGPRRLGAGHGVSERPDVLEQRSLGEGGLADASVNDAGLLDAELHS